MNQGGTRLSGAEGRVRCEELLYPGLLKRRSRWQQEVRRGPRLRVPALVRHDAGGRDRIWRCERRIRRQSGSHRRARRRAGQDCAILEPVRHRRVSLRGTEDALGAGPVASHRCASEPNPEHVMMAPPRKNSSALRGSGRRRRRRAPWGWVEWPPAYRICRAVTENGKCENESTTRLSPLIFNSSLSSRHTGLRCLTSRRETEKGVTS